jgi:glycosyltransferase involved in cell wall biosynthesis
VGIKNDGTIAGDAYLNVLQISHCYYPPFLDCSRQYAALFKGTDIKVTTVYLTGEADAEVERASESDEVIFLGYKSKDVGGLKLSAIRRIRQIVAGKPFRFCIVHRAKPTYVALIATSLPVISVRHNFGDFDRLGRRLLVNLFRNRLLLLGVSNAVRNEMRARLPHWPKEQIETLYNRIDVKAVQAELLSKNEARQYLGVPLDVWVVGNVGRLHHDKDQATLIRGFAKALPRLPANSLLLVMGSGPLEQELKNLAAELGVAEKVMFAGQVPNGRRYFRAFDVFALTSDHEPFGMVILEALAAGLPIISSNCGGAAEVAADIGLMFPLADSVALASQLEKVASEKDSNPALRLERLHERFSDEAAQQKFRNLAFVQAWGLFN